MKQGSQAPRLTRDPMPKNTEDKLKTCIKAAYDLIGERVVCDPELRRILEQRIIRWSNLLRNAKKTEIEEKGPLL